MKRLISAALALSLLGTTAAIAQPYHGGHGYGGYSHGYHGGYHRGGNCAGVALGVGLGLFALAAIAASSHDHDRYRDGYYDAPPPPPPPPGYRGYGDRGDW